MGQNKKILERIIFNFKSIKTNGIIKSHHADIFYKIYSNVYSYYFIANDSTSYSGS